MAYVCNTMQLLWPQVVIIPCAQTQAKLIIVCVLVYMCICMYVLMCVFIGSCLATNLFIGDLPAMGWGWVIIK